VLKIVENLWAIGALPRTPLGSSQRSPDLVARGQGACAPPKPHARCRPSASIFGPSVLASNEQSLTSPCPSTHYRTCTRPLFALNHLHGYWTT